MAFVSEPRRGEDYDLATGKQSVGVEASLETSYVCLNWLPSSLKLHCGGFGTARPQRTRGTHLLSGSQPHSLTVFSLSQSGLRQKRS